MSCHEPLSLSVTQWSTGADCVGGWVGGGGGWYAPSVDTPIPV